MPIPAVIPSHFGEVLYVILCAGRKHNSNAGFLIVRCASRGRVRQDALWQSMSAKGYVPAWRPSAAPVSANSGRLAPPSANQPPGLVGN
eukprot:3322130-Amphidinium_carterae.1